jgi:alpha-1,3-rhamnosyl/mannosyltransferase
MPLGMRLWGADLIHGAANVLPLTTYGLPGVVTVHDLAIYEHPEWFPEQQWLATRVLVPRSLQKARLLICPSEATRKAATKHFGVPPERCRVIPHGVEPGFALPAAQVIRDEVRKSLKLPERYILQVGTIQPRKNYVTTLKAIARIPESERIPLVVAGDFGWKFEPVLQAVQELGLKDWVRFVGYVDMPYLHALYHMAEVVAFPSYDEGFGLPVLEAFAAGVPIVAASAGAIPEVAGHAALLCDPDDDACMAEQILQLLRDKDLRERKVAEGRARASVFSWAASANAHLKAYREAVA